MTSSLRLGGLGQEPHVVDATAAEAHVQPCLGCCPYATGLARADILVTVTMLKSVS